jgi:heme/copper-type cytochrome/quinol oxidase subunit 4
MIAQLLYRMTTKIRTIGYEKERTQFMVGFLVTVMVVVTVLTGMVWILQHTEWNGNSGHSTGYCVQIAALPHYAPFGIHR